MNYNEVRNIRKVTLSIGYMQRAVWRKRGSNPKIFYQ